MNFIVLRLWKTTWAQVAVGRFASNVTITRDLLNMNKGNLPHEKLFANILQGVERIVWHLRNEKHPLSWIVSRTLFYSRAGRFFTVNCGLYAIRFFPTGLSLMKWLNPSYNIEDEILLRAILQPGDFVIDVGANIGTLSLAAASLVGAEGRVIALEPNRRIFQYLQKNITLNRFDNILPINCAVGDKEGEGFLSDQKDDSQNKIVLEGKEKIKITTIDEQAKDIEGRVKLLKVDVEGYEKFVFLGATKTLSRIDYIYFEVFEAHFSPLGYTTGDLLTFLGKHGFYFSRFDESGREISLGIDFVPSKCMNLLAQRKIQ